MVQYIYPCRIEEVSSSEFLASFRDVPEALTSADTFESAVTAAAEALAVAVEGYLEGGREVPDPSPATADETWVPLDPVIAARLVLVREMARQQLSKVALAGRIGTDEKAVRRMITGRGASLEKTLDALRAIGVQPSLAI